MSREERGNNAVAYLKRAAQTRRTLRSMGRKVAVAGNNFRLNVLTELAKASGRRDLIFYGEFDARRRKRLRGKIIGEQKVHVLGWTVRSSAPVVQPAHLANPVL